MRTRMPRSLWAVLLVAYALLACAVYLFTGGSAVAPCLGGSIAQAATDRCVAEWIATKPIELRLLETPIPAIVVFMALVAMTISITRDRSKGELPQSG